MARLPFADASIGISQVFGVNPGAYAKFGIAGHNGVDHFVPCGTPLYAMATGVVEVGDQGRTGYGKFVRIYVTEGILADGEALVAHLSRLDVVTGQMLRQGDPIGLSGTTGNSSGCHTHSGIRPPGSDPNNGFGGYVDPLPYLNGGAVVNHPVDPGVVTYNPEYPPAITHQPPVLDYDPSLPADYVYSPGGLLIPVDASGLPVGTEITPSDSMKVVLMLAAAAFGLYVVTSE